MLRWLQTAVQPLDRQALVIALGLLGAPAPMELAWPDPADTEDAAAYLAFVALGVDDEGERIRLATAADMRARGPAREVTEMDLGRIECGERLWGGGAGHTGNRCISVANHAPCAFCLSDRTARAERNICCTEG